MSSRPGLGFPGNRKLAPDAVAAQTTTDWINSSNTSLKHGSIDDGSGFAMVAGIPMCQLMQPQSLTTITHTDIPSDRNAGNQ